MIYCVVTHQQTTMVHFMRWTTMLKQPRIILGEIVAVNQSVFWQTMILKILLFQTYLKRVTQIIGQVFVVVSVMDNVHHHAVAFVDHCGVLEYFFLY